MFGLRPGTYNVCATPSRTGRQPGARRLRGAPYLTTCYPSAPAGGGERVAVDGTPRPPLTIIMQRLPGFAISGRVTSESSNPQLQVTIFRLGSAASGVIPVNLQPGGVFKAQGLPPGRYLVHANVGPVAIPPFQAAAVERAYRIVELTTGNVAGLELLMTRNTAATIAQDLAALPPETPPAAVHSNEDPPPPAEASTKPRRLAISGRVADENGNPLAGITVAVVSRYRGGGSAGRIFPQTDDRGSFRLFDLPPGRHAVCASPGRPLPFEAEAPRRSVYVSTCFPYVTHAADAIQVTLTDHDVEGLDIRLQRRAVYAVTGQILSADGHVAPPAVIEATRVDSAAPLPRDGSIQPSGSFRLTNLLPGSYLVSAASLPSRSATAGPPMGRDPHRRDLGGRRWRGAAVEEKCQRERTGDL